MHPYEIDTQEIDFEIEHLSNDERSKTIRFHKLQMRNRNAMRKKINKLLSDFKFTTVREIIESSENRI